jgi:hypothetical protein
MNTLRSLILICIIALFSCKKKETQPAANKKEPEKTYDNYSALKVGNYWIYREYMFTDSLRATGYEDSCYIEKDTLINTKTYYKHCTASPLRAAFNVQYLRDSLSYLVNSEGAILFSSEDFNRVFRTYKVGPNSATPDTLTVTEKMTSKNAAAVTPAGTLLSYVFTKTYYFPKNHTHDEVALNTYYVKDMVMVKSVVSFFYDKPKTTIEKQLVRYRVK